MTIYIYNYIKVYDSKFYEDCMFEICVISLLRRLMIYFNFLNGIRAHVQYRAFATLQIELYHVVHYDSKRSTKFDMDCMFEIFVISLLRRRMIIYLIFKKVLGSMFDTELLQHSKLN